MKIKSKKLNRFQILFKKNKRFRFISVICFLLIGVILFTTFSFLLKRFESKGKLSAAIASEPQSLDPTFCTDTDTETVIVNCFEGLMMFDEKGGVKKACASDYTLSEDGLVYTFTIAPDAMWSNGQPVVANDFVYSWQRTANPYNASRYRYLFENIAGYDKILEDFEKEKNSETDEEGAYITINMSDLWVKSADSKTLVVKLKEKDASFLKKCAMVPFLPLCESAVKPYTRIWSTDEELFVSNGAFTLSSWMEGNYLELLPNEHYRDKEKIKLESIKFNFIPDGKDAQKEFKNSKVLFTSSLNEEKINKTAKKRQYNSYEEFGSNFLYFNLSRAPFDNIKVREALTLAIDRERLVEETCPQKGEPAYGILSNGFENYRESSEEYFDVYDTESNIEKAQQLLEKAGYKNGKNFPRFEYVYNDNEFSRKTAELLKEMWEENLGVECTLKCVSWSKLDELRENGNFAVAKGGLIAPYSDTAEILDAFTSENSFSGWKDAEYDNILKQMVISAGDKNNLSHNAEKLIMEDFIVCPLYYYKSGYLISGRVKDYYVTNSGVAYFMYADVTI